MKRWLVVFLIPLLFLVVQFVTLKDYGISWDEPIHFYRGQAYLYYFLTGKKNFDDLPRLVQFMPKYEGYSLPDGKFSTDVAKRVSYYQNIDLDFDYWLINDSGHPVINDELAAITNLIFYQKLGIVGDINSHHLFNVFSATLLVIVVAVFAYEVGGIIPSIFSSLTLSLYPLFFSESHFNIKDPPQTAFFALTIYAFWKSLKQFNYKWLLVSIVSFAIAFGIKFNILFLPLIFTPYLVVRYKGTGFLSRFPRKYWTFIFLAPLIIAAIFIGSWPYLWQDVVGNTLKIFRYYKEIGSGFEYQPGFYFWKFNLYPIVWIITTTQPVTLLLLFIGIFIVLKDRTSEKTYWLWLLWFIVPTLRVTTPGASIYGGVRQIMEYIPAVALLAGVGADALVKRFNITGIKLLIFLALVSYYLLQPLIKYHPHQNVYFNFLIGGLKGAKERNIPYWGNSFGNAYYPAINWFNQNAEEGANLALIQATGLSLPRIMLREDLEYWNNYWSGIKRNGEYLLELTHDGPVKVYQYAWNYVDRFLVPVYEVKVDGVAIAMVWKNDLEHTKADMRLQEKLYLGKISVEVVDKIIRVTLGKEVVLSRLSISFKGENQCSPVAGTVRISVDGNDWKEMSEPVPFPQISWNDSVSDNRMNYFFAADGAKYIEFIANSQYSCIFEESVVSIFTLE